MGARGLGRGLISAGPQSSGGEQHGGEEVPGKLGEAGCDTAEVLELAEEPLDEVALAVEVSVDRALDLAIRLGGDVGLSACAADQIDDGLGVVAAVGDQGSGRRQALDQRGDGGLV